MTVLVPTPLLFITARTEGAFQHRLTFAVNATVATNQTGRHRRVREDSLGVESLALPLARLDNALSNRT